MGIEYCKVTESSEELRMLARQALHGNWKKSVLSVLICYTAAFILPEAVRQITYYISLLVLDIYVPTIGVTILYYTCSLLFASLLLLSLTRFFLFMFRRNPQSIKDLLYGFKHLRRSFGIFLLQGLFVGLWAALGALPFYLLLYALFYLGFLTGTSYLLLSALYVITGIISGYIASLRYSLSMYLAADNPHISCMDAIRQSKNIMKDQKRNLFFLDLSFCFWWISAVIASSIIEAVLPQYPSFNYGSGSYEIYLLWSIFAAFCQSVPYFFLWAYRMTAHTAFYEIAVGHLRKDESLPQMQTHYNNDANEGGLTNEREAELENK